VITGRWARWGADRSYASFDEANVSITWDAL
jgi:hypothetical protein